MTKDEAIEAGELASALEECDAMLRAVEGVHASYPLTPLMLDIFDGDEDGGTGIGGSVRVRPWLIIATLQTLRGVIVQRLAALGVDTTDGEEASRG